MSDKNDFVKQEANFLGTCSIRSTYLSTTVTLVLCLGFSLISGVVTARLLAPIGRGELAVLLYYPSLIAALLPIGLPLAISFRIAGRSHNAKEFASTGIWLCCAIGVLGSVLAVIFVPHFLPNDKQNLRGAVQLMCLLGFPMILSPTMFAIERALKLFDWVNGLQLLASGGYIAILGILWVTHATSSLSIAVSLQILQLCLLFLHIWRLDKRFFLSPIRWANCTSLLWDGLRFFAPAAAATVYSIADRGVLIRKGTEAEIGYYAIAYSLAYPLSLLAEAFAQIGFIEVASDVSSDPSDLIVRRIQMLQVIIAGSAFAAGLVVSPVIRMAFGLSFTRAIDPAYILLGAMSFRALSKALEAMLRATNHTWPGAISSATSLFVLIAIGVFAAYAKTAQELAAVLVISDAIGFAILVGAASFILHIPAIRFVGIRMQTIHSLRENIRLSCLAMATRFIRERPIP
jgi:O-antigen/teichoic acid export membrane protein